MVLLIRGLLPIPLGLLPQGLLEAAQDLGISEVALGEPGRGHDAEALAQHAELLRRARDHHDGLLHGRARDVGRPREELRGVHLSRAGDAEEGGRWEGALGGAEEGEVGEVFGGAEKRGGVSIVLEEERNL